MMMMRGLDHELKNELVKVKLKRFIDDAGNSFMAPSPIVEDDGDGYYHSFIRSDYFIHDADPQLITAMIWIMSHTTTSLY